MPKKRIHDAPRVIALDIETAPCVAYVWRPGKQVVSIDQIQHDCSLISYSWAEWTNGKRVRARYDSTFMQANKRDDAAIVKRLHALLDGYTHVIAHNGARFDWPMIAGMFYRHQLPPISRPLIIDTRVLLQSIGGQSSYKLAWLTRDSERPKLAHQRYPGISLWVEWLNGAQAAEREMRAYNNRDVESMCDLLNAALPYCRSPSLAGIVPRSIGREEQTIVCPRCGSDDMRPQGFALTQAGRYQRYRCGSCGGWSQSRYIVREKRRHIVKPV